MTLDDVFSIVFWVSWYWQSSW